MLTIEAARAAVQKTRSERSLRFYLQSVSWPVIEPNTLFRPGWHIDAMCSHVQGVFEGDIRNLLITVPPRHTKSIIVSVAAPSWAWTKTPELRLLYASFSYDLSLEHGVLARRIILSDTYQHHWGTKYQLSYDQNVKSFYENDKRGYRISTSVGGTVTGRGGDIIVLDDPHNLQTIDSDLDRQSVLHFWRHTWSSRLNDPKTGRRIVVMQRGHEEDLAALIMDTGGDEWVHLNLPTEYEPTPWVDIKANVAYIRGSVATQAERDEYQIQTEAQHYDLHIVNQVRVNPLGWRDPRTENGELLNPERFGPTEVAQAKRDLGPRGYAPQHQQRPQPMGGGLFRRENVKIISPYELPRLPFSEVRGWDFAATEEAL